MSPVPLAPSAASPTPPMAASPARVTLVWLTLGLLLLLLAGVLALHALRSWQLARDHAKAEAEASATVAAAQIGSALQHLEDIVLHTRFIFEQFGPGLLERDPVARQRADAQPPHRFVALLNAAGDPVLVLPTGQALPGFGPLATVLADDRSDRVRVEPLVLPDGRWSLLMAQRLAYPDETYAGAAVAALEPAVLDRALATFFSNNLLEARLQLEPGRGPALAEVPSRAEPGERLLMAEVAVPGAAGLMLQVDADLDTMRAQWRRQMALPVAGAAGVAAVIVILGVALVRGVRREIASELRAQKAAAEAQVRSRFLAHMSHEIRTPMNGVLGAVELLAAQPLSADQRRLVEVVRSSGESLLGLLNDLLDASKIEAGRLRLQPQPFDLADCIEDVVVLLAPLAHSRGVRVWHRLAADLPETVTGDALRLRQVITNLMSNAIKFTLRGHVVLACEMAQDEGGGPAIRLTIEDTGIGIPPEDLPRLFTPFAQLHGPGLPRFGGTGLGLSIADSLVRLMGGRIEVASTPFEGSRFTVTLPVRDASPPAPPTPTPKPGADLVILLSADREGVRALGEHLAWGGHRVRPAASLDEALAEARQAAVMGVSELTWLVDARVLPEPATGTAGAALRHTPGWNPSWHAVLLSEAPPASASATDAHAPEAWRRLPIRRVELVQAVQGRGRDSAATPGAGSLAPHAAHGLRSTEAPVPPTVRPLIRAHVLAAEDNPVNRMILAEMLTHLGCDAELVEDGSAALAALEHKPFDVVLMDCQMPGMDGFEATRRWRDLERARGTGQRTPVIALTAYAMAGDRQRCLDAGMDDHLGKPYALEDLAAALQRWIKRPATA